MRKKDSEGAVSREVRDICVKVEIPGVVKRWLRMAEKKYRPEGAGDWYMTMVFWAPEMEMWDGKKGVDEMRVVWRKK